MAEEGAAQIQYSTHTLLWAAAAVAMLTAPTLVTVVDQAVAAVAAEVLAHQLTEQVLQGKVIMVDLHT
jgi:hypothetical protein